MWECGRLPWGMYVPPAHTLEMVVPKASLGGADKKEHCGVIILHNTDG